MTLSRIYIISLLCCMAIWQPVIAEDDNNAPAELIPICDVNDPSYKKVGGRNICKRECREGEIGPSGKLCTTNEDTGSGEKFCDCGV